MRRPASLLVLAVLLSAVLLGTPGAPGASARPSDTQGDRDKVRAAEAQVASNLNTLKASQAQLEHALGVLQQNVDIEDQRLSDAQAAVDEAQGEIDQAEDGIRANSAHLHDLDQAMVRIAVQVYVQPNDVDLTSVLDSSNAADAVERDAFRRATSDSASDLTDKIRTTEANLQIQREAAANARAKARQRRAAVAAEVAKVKKARAEQQKLVDGVQQRINGQITRSIQLAKQDKQLSYEIALQQAALEARLLAAQQAAAAAAAAAAAGATPYGSGGSESGPLAGPGAVTPSGGSGNVQLCTVGGITVNCQISSQLKAMLAAAAADGLHLTGSGWRSPEAQVELRREHCGTSYYAIYEEDPSSCSPPTATPGQSMHEVGLAIDFSGVSSHSSPVYQWLAGHAAAFGFYNLPSEPWHWSINGH
jgi:hypothetical protein